MASNSFGTMFRFTTYGESHGPAIGVVVDGVPSGISLCESDIQPFLDKRRPGQSKLTTQRKETDEVQILSGVFEGKTTGHPINLLIPNQDQRSKDYGEIKDKFRPGHADYTYFMKYGVRDYRGGGRSSARETACRVAAGAVARKVLGKKIKVRGALVQVGDQKIDRSNWDWDQVQTNDLFCPDAKSIAPWTELISNLRKDGSSIGGVIEVVASGVPVGLGAPTYNKLNADIASGLMGINAVKAVEIGVGFEVVMMRGEHYADQMALDADGMPTFLSNHGGGIAGGISTGQDIVARFAVKPTCSLLTPLKTLTKDMKETTIQTKGRHDPCVGIRAVPVGEAMLANVLADHFLMSKTVKVGEI